ncbi:gamma-glutamyltranspeptidase 1 [Artemisia annua]|uniref:Glutathione hydrolase n=1 Tax=Artemisia annua TaxID=35608 RepID=A0A2U1KDW0_ARTAN|nr:gamma-glutamyltranspeptidase 1 [Artemisia annua]
MLPSRSLRWSFIGIMIFLLLRVATARREIITKQNGVVATDELTCSRIGRDVLQEGGNAVDASVAASFCLGVVSPASSGLGGGAFMLLRLANGTTRAFDMRETAPILALRDMYAGNATLKEKGPPSIAVPGLLAGLHKVWEQYGKLPWKRLVQPAENLARKGFKISPYLHMQVVKSQTDVMADDGLRAIFATGGRLLKTGETCHNKMLAQTLQVISNHGIKPFYNGSIGFRLVKDVRRSGGILKLEDLQKYEVKVRDPIFTEFLGLKVIGMPPPSSGGPAMALILNIIALYGAQKNISGPLVAHRHIEAIKHAFAKRMNLGDPDFVNIEKDLADMISPKFAQQLKKTICDNKTFGSTHYGGKWNQIEDHDTSHMSIVDKERNAVSLTTSINSYFGAKILSPNTGIILNNHMDDFSIPTNPSPKIHPPAPSNFISPGKRPLSSATPTIVIKDGNVKAVLGASGGVKIIPATTEVFLNYFVKGMDPLSAILAPRLYHQLIPNVVRHEKWTAATHDHFEIDARTKMALRMKGHVLRSYHGPGSVCQLVVQEERGGGEMTRLVAVSDPRKGGFPAGY